MNKKMSFFLSWQIVACILCIGLLVAVVRRLLEDRCPSFEKALTISKAEVIETRVHIYYDQRSQYPHTIAETSNCCATVVDTKYTLSDLFLDGWKSPFVYKAWKEGYSLVSAGPDKVIGTKDDIIWFWPNGK